MGREKKYNYTDVPEDFGDSLVFENMFYSVPEMAKRRGISKATMYKYLLIERRNDEIDLFECMGNYLNNIIKPMRKKKNPIQTKIIKVVDVPKGYIY